MASFPTGFFGGFAQGTRQRWAMELEQDKLDQQIKQRREANQQKLITRYKEIGNTLYEAMLTDDEPTRNTVIDAIAAEVENLRGKPLNKQFVNWMRKNPEDAAQVLENSAKSGVSPSVLFELQDDPVLLSQGLLAMGKAKREREARGLRGDGGGSAATPSGPSEQPLGGGLNLGGVTQAGGMASTPAPQQQAGGDANRKVRIGALSRRIDGLRRLGRPEAEIKPLVDERNMLEEQEFKLSSAAPIAAAQESEKPVPAETLAEAKAANPSLLIRPGMTWGEFRQLTGGQTATTTPVTGTPGPRGVPVINNPDGTHSTERTIGIEVDGKHFVIPTIVGGKQMSEEEAIRMWRSGQNPEVGQFASQEEASRFARERSAAGGALGGGVTVRTPAQKQREQEDITRRSKPLSEELLRDPSVQRLQLSTVGQYEDAVSAGRVKPKTREQLDRDAARVRQTEELAFKDLGKIREDGENARKTQNAYDTIGVMLSRAGPTGALVGPVRQGFFNIAQAFGAKPEALDAIQTVEAGVQWLASQVLRDFSGPDSDRDVLRAIAMQPGINKTPGANKILLAIAKAEGMRRQERMANANKWTGEYGSLSAKDPTGKTFYEWWDEWSMSKMPSINETILRSGGIDPKKVWKQSRNDPGRQGP